MCVCFCKLDKSPCVKGEQKWMKDSSHSVHAIFPHQHNYEIFFYLVVFAKNGTNECDQNNNILNKKY